MRKFIYSLIILFSTTYYGFAEIPTGAEKIEEGEYNVFMLSDAGRNGSYDQRKIGTLMGEYAEIISPEFVISCGDLFHYDGIQSTSDPILLSNYENIYTHGELHCPWYGVLGNHEYKGNTQAMMDYSDISRRWNMPSRYYTFTKQLDDDDPESESIRFVFIDTAPLMSKYHTQEYPDAMNIDESVQLQWIDSVLSVAKEKWVLVIGHHPVYSYDTKDDSESIELRSKLEPIFDRHQVDFYFCGHIHTFQHLRNETGKTDYVVNASASLQRPPLNGEYTVYNSTNTGFAILTFNEGEMNYHFINSEGEVEYSIQRKK